MTRRQQIGSRGGKRFALNHSDKQLSAIGQRAANARWAGLTAEERKREHAKGRTPLPRCACGRYTAHTAAVLGSHHHCKLESGTESVRTESTAA